MYTLCENDPVAETDMTLLPLNKKISSMGYKGCLDIEAISWSLMISEPFITFIGISPICCGLVILSFNLIRNSEYWSETTPTGFLLS